jgi:pimeloyl-ACP methyl ester carboxylesterase
MMEQVLKVNNFELRTISNKGFGIPIVFLHGYSFTSKVWQDINTLKALEEKKIPFLCLDMPYGRVSECKPKTRKEEANVALVNTALLNLFDSYEVILVGASLGGYMALEYSLKHPIKGLMLIGPAYSLQEKFVKNYHKLAIPTTLIYGTRDTFISLKEMKELTSILPDAALVVYENAGHPAYLDKPEEFKKNLLALYKKAT